MQLKTKCLQVCHRAVKIWAPGYVLNFCSKTLLPWRRVQIFFFLWKTIWLHLHHSALGNKPMMPSVKFQNFLFFDLAYRIGYSKSHGRVSWTLISGLIRPTIIRKGSLERRKSWDFNGATLPRSLTLPGNPDNGVICGAPLRNRVYATKVVNITTLMNWRPGSVRSLQPFQYSTCKMQWETLRSNFRLWLAMAASRVWGSQEVIIYLDQI